MNRTKKTVAQKEMREVLEHNLIKLSGKGVLQYGKPFYRSPDLSPQVKTGAKIGYFTEYYYSTAPGACQGLRKNYFSEFTKI